MIMGGVGDGRGEDEVEVMIISTRDVKAGPGYQMAENRGFMGRIVGSNVLKVIPLYAESS